MEDRAPSDRNRQLEVVAEGQTVDCKVRYSRSGKVYQMGEDTQRPSRRIYYSQLSWISVKEPPKNIHVHISSRIGTQNFARQRIVRFLEPRKVSVYQLLIVFARP